MWSKFRAWPARRRERRRQFDAAWYLQDRPGSDGLSPFERDAIAALEPVVGKLALVRNENGCLIGQIPNSEMRLFLWGNEAQVWASGSKFRREYWDYDTPNESIADLLRFVRSQSGG